MVTDIEKERPKVINKTAKAIRPNTEPTIREPKPLNSKIDSTYADSETLGVSEGWELEITFGSSLEASSRTQASQRRDELDTGTPHLLQGRIFQCLASS